MSKIKVAKEVALELLDNAVDNSVYDTSRWSILYEAVVPYEGKHYRVYYSRGATEYQDEGPFEYDNEVELVEVKQVEKLTKVWEEV